MDFDLILAGGGLANGLIALRLAQLRPEVRVVIVEAGAGVGGNHSWSSFEADIMPDQVAWTAPLMAHRWDRYSIRFPAHSRTLEAGYRTATSATLAAAIDAAGVAVLTGAEIVALDAGSVTLADQRTLTARAVIDGRGQGAPVGTADREQRGKTNSGRRSTLDLRAQKFLGIEVELTASHGLDGPVIMDACVPQLDGYRFVYTLPFGPCTVLVEDTYYSDGPDLASDVLRARVFDYIAAQGWTVARVIREEIGVLPIALHGDIDAFWDDAANERENTGVNGSSLGHGSHGKAGDGAGERAHGVAILRDGIPRSGLRAALFNPITGYSFPDAVRVADLVAGLPDLSAAALYAALRQHSVSTWHERRFYRFLNRLLFTAAEPSQRYKVLERFYRLDAGLVGRFYAGRSTAWDKVRTLAGKPPVPLGRALGVLLRS